VGLYCDALEFLFMLAFSDCVLFIPFLGDVISRAYHITQQFVTLYCRV